MGVVNYCLLVLPLWEVGQAICSSYELQTQANSLSCRGSFSCMSFRSLKTPVWWSLVYGFLDQIQLGERRVKTCRSSNTCQTWRQTSVKSIMFLADVFIIKVSYCHGGTSDVQKGRRAFTNNFQRIKEFRSYLPPLGGAAFTEILRTRFIYALFCFLCSHLQR